LLTFDAIHPDTGLDIWVLPITGQQDPRPLVQTGFNEGGAHFSPDGRWLAFVSDESGRREVYVQPFPEGDGRWQVSIQGGTEPLWARSGRELFYRNGDQIMSVTMTAEPEFSVGKPRTLFEGRFEQNPVMAASYDVSPDNQLFITPLRGDDPEVTQFHVVLDWFEELKRLVPKE
jgi:hypothetical protein